MTHIQKYHYIILILLFEMIILSATTIYSHVSEHILVAWGIGSFSIIIFYSIIKKPIFTLGWYTGTLYYLGREVRDFEKKTGGENTNHIDIGGFFGPFFVNIVNFWFIYLIYQDYHGKKKNKIIITIL